MDIQAQDQGQMTSGEREMGWRAKVADTIEDYKKDGKSTAELFDPKQGNSKYIGSPEFMAEFMPEQALPTATKGGPDVSSLEAVKRTDSVVSMIPKGSQWIISASGGVQIDSWNAARKQEKSPQVADARSKAAPAAGRWWWD